MKRLLVPSILALTAAVLTPGCGQHGGGIVPPANGASAIGVAAQPATRRVDHVVIIVQENRSVDNLFNGLPNADTVRSGLDSEHARVALQPISLSAPYDISHRHAAFETEYAAGSLDGFNLAPSHCQVRKKCPNKVRRAYAYVPHFQTKPYFTMAEEYGFADRMFQSNQGPSFPAHQYLLSGTSSIEENVPLLAAENPLTAQQHWTGGCDSPPGSLVYVIDQAGRENQQVYPCFNRPALTSLLDKRELSWRYYGTHLGAGLWNAPDAVLSVRQSPQFRYDVVSPPARILSDIKNGDLANVVWVTPTGASSDHAGQTDGTGPSWVAAVVNAVGKSKFWNDSVVFVVWDDWGGWYDHVQPPMYNSYELGFRVPLIAISPYVPKGFVSHRRHEFGSILKYVERNFGLGSLGATDERADDLSDFFDYQHQPRKFVAIPAPHGAKFFLSHAFSSTDPDDDY